MWDMTHSHVGHDSFICGTWLIYTWDMTHSHVGHDSFICGIYAWYRAAQTREAVHGDGSLFIADGEKTFKNRGRWHAAVWELEIVMPNACVAWLVSMCDVTHGFVQRAREYVPREMCDVCDVTHWDECHDSFVCVRWLDLMWGGLEIVMLDVCVTWLVEACDVTRWDMWHDSLRRVTWLVETCDMIGWDMWRDSLRYVTWLLDMGEVNRSMCATWLVDIHDVTWSHVWGIAGCLCDVTRWDGGRDSGLVEMCMQECTHRDMWYDRDVLRDSYLLDYVTRNVLHMKETCDVTLIWKRKIWKKYVT